MEAQETAPVTLRNWLETNKCHGVRELTLLLGGWPYPNASYYRQDRKDADGKDYQLEAIYVVGKLPKFYAAQKGQVIFDTLQGVEWYVAVHYDGEPQEGQPFGANFILRSAPTGVLYKDLSVKPRKYSFVMDLIRALPESAPQTDGEQPSK